MLQSQIKFLFALIITLYISITLSGCGLFSSSSSNSSKNINIEKIAIAPLLSSLAQGVELQMSATAFYSDGSKSDITDEAQWQSSDTSISTIDNNGILKTLSAGSHTVSATYQELSAQTGLIVSDATLKSLNINPANPSIAKNTNIEMNVIGIFSDGSTQDLSKQVNWTIADTSVLSQLNNNIFQGIEIGKSQLTASVSSVSNSTTIDIKAGTLTAIQLEYNKDLITVGDEIPLQAIGIYAEGYRQNISDQVTWDLSDTSILNIESTSQIASALLSGEVTITAQVGDIQTSETVIVDTQTATLQSLELITSDTPLSVEENSQLRVIGTYSDGTQVDLTDAATWTSDNPEIVGVSNNINYEGEALALQTGSANISVEVDGVTTNAVVTVSSASLQSIEITLQRQTLSAGTSLQLFATGIYSDNSTRDLTKLVTWQSQNSNLLHVSNHSIDRGTITALQAGSTSVTAILGNIQDSADITISDASLVSINIENTGTSIPVGHKSTFQAIGIFSDGRKQDISNSVVWSSSDTAVLSVSNETTTAGEFSALNAGSTTITASYRNINSTINMTVTAITLNKIVIQSAETSMAAGTSLQLVATAFYSDDSSSNVSTLANWSSDNASILSVSNLGNKGFISALSPGETTIRAEYLGIASELSINISDATLTSINISPQNINLINNTYLGLTATGIYSNNTYQDITREVLWASNQADIVFVSNAQSTQGNAYALSTGEAIITATLNNLSANVSINVSDDTIDGITILFDGESTMALGSQKTITAIGNYSSGASQDLSQQATWQSSDTSICTISTAEDNSGVLVGHSAGLCTITASFNGINSTVFFTISEASLQSISISPSSIVIAKGTQQQLTATGTYSDASTQDLTNQVSWQTASTAINISSSGLITGQTVGSATVQANLLTLNDSVDITISAETLQSITISPDTLTINKGADQQLTATGVYTDSSTQDITQAVLWESSDTLIATVSNDQSQAGLVSALSTGNLSITAKMDGVTSSSSITVESNPTAPISLSLSASPFVILNDGNDTSTISVKVLATDSTQTVPDGTKVNLSILNGSATLDKTSIVTNAGEASFSLTSKSKAVITIQATVENTEITNYVSIYSTDNFSEVIGRGVLLSANVINNVVQPGSIFGLAIINYANRSFTLNSFQLGTQSELIYGTATFEELSNNVFQPGNALLRGWETETDRENSFRAFYTLTDTSTATDFVVGVIFNLPENK